MKRSVLVLLVTSAITVDAEAQAETRHGLSVEAEIFDYAYREELDGTTIVRDDGLFGGAAASYVESVGGGVFLRGRLAVSAGAVDYRSNEGSSIDDVSQSIGQLELHLGYDIALGSGATLTPFAGLGSRFLSDNSGGRESTDGLLGYDREISYGYIPMGATVTIPVRHRTLLSLTAQYNWFIDGDAKSKFSDVSSELPDVKLELDEGEGFEANAAIAFPVGSQQITVGPFLRSWRIGRSDSFLLLNPDDLAEGIEIFEPRNRTTELGLRIGFAF